MRYFTGKRRFGASISCMPHSYGASFSGDGFFGPRIVVNTITRIPNRIASVTMINIGSGVPIWGPSFLNRITSRARSIAPRWCILYTSSHRNVAQLATECQIQGKRLDKSNQGDRESERSSSYVGTGG